MPTTRDPLTAATRVTRELLLDVWTAFPAYVARVHEDLGRQYVDVTPAVAQPVVRDGAVAMESLPTLPAVPYGTLGAGGFYAWLPPAVGDVVLVVVSKVPIHHWLRTGKVDVAGGHTEQAQADATGDHAIGNAMAFPMGVRPVGSTIPDVSADEMVFGVEGADEPRVTLSKAGTVMIAGSLHVTGDVSADGEVTAQAASPATAVAVSTHKHVDAMGSTQSPTPGT